MRRSREEEVDLIEGAQLLVEFLLTLLESLDLTLILI